MQQCAQCKSLFEITDSDRQFYDKIGVPEPTWCPACRMQRRMAFRNERNLYKRKCDLSGKDIVSVYPPTSPFKIYEQLIWWSDKWDALSYGHDFDFSRPFFDQFHELILKVPRISLQNWANENSEYCNDTDHLKNCYLCFNAANAQDSYYCNTFGYSRNCVDMFWCLTSELCYECTKTHESYHSFWCLNSKNLNDCFFCEDCHACKHCFGCFGLRQKEYCVYNKQLTKNEYESFMSNFHFTYPEIETAKRKFKDFSLTIPHKNLQNLNAEDCVGDYITASKKCVDCFDVMNSENIKYVWDGVLNNSMDCFNTGTADYIYESLAVYNSNNLKFCDKCNSSSSDLLYCDFCSGCESCFGCTNLSHKKYCILNKQYSKEEYEKLVPKIIGYMKSTREWGEFFPAALSPFGYNDTLAQEYFPLTKEEAIQKDFVWNDYVSPKITSTKTISANRLPNAIGDVPDDILNWAIECEKDGKTFKIIPQELKFYRGQGLPVPHLCPDCRHYARKAQINPRQLWNRKCDNCGTDIKTTYSPDRPEKVYCEKCYLETVY